jgi:uncharacterized protein YjbI with pentapeptide repeats
MNKCIEKDCRECALSLSDRCWRHIYDKDAYKGLLSAHIKSTNSINGFYLRRIQFVGAQWQGIDARGADLAGCDLQGADLAAADMRGANLTGANLRLANLASVDLEDAHMLKCDFSLARMWHAVIKNANISEADLSGADCLKTVFSNVKFWHVKLTDARFITRYSFVGRAPIDETGALSASEAYRGIKQYFISNGRYDDSSWASFKEKDFQMRHLFKEKSISCVPLFVMGLLCGYGEKPARIIVSSLSLILLYSVFYNALEVLKVPQGLALEGFSFWDYIYFSIVTFTTVGFGDLSPRMVPLYQMLVGSEAFTGVFMMGLFVFTLARKYTAR